MTAFNYRKSSYSGSGGDCVEIAFNVSDVRAVRDSKDPDGPHLEFTPADFVAFLATLRNSRRGRP